MSGRRIEDAAVSPVTKALPNGAAAIYTDAIDTGARNADAQFPESVEYQITLPTVTTGELGDAATLIVAACAGETDTPTAVIADRLLVLTGAGGAGASGASVRWRPPSDLPRYLRFRVTNSAAGNISGKVVTVNQYH